MKGVKGRGRGGMVAIRAEQEGRAQIIKCFLYYAQEFPALSAGDWRKS